MGAPRTLVTGATGFTGRYLVDELIGAGHTVFATGNAAEGGFSEEVHYLSGDLSDAVRLSEIVARSRPDHVIHLAALAFVAEDDGEAYYRTNLIGTRHLLEALTSLTDCPRTVLLASSASVYGAGDGRRIVETHPPAPVNDYGVSKIAAELLARTYGDRLPLVVVRPFNYTGIGQSVQFLVPKIVDHFRRSASRISLGNIDIRRDFSDVRDVVRIYRRLLDTSPTGATLNVCSGVETSLRDVIDACAELTGHDIEVDVDTRFVRARDIPVLVGDPTCLQRALGDHAMRPLRETLTWMLRA